VWDPALAVHIPPFRRDGSYGEVFSRCRPGERLHETGPSSLLGVPDGISIFLDNGAFYFASQDDDATPDEYDDFGEEDQA